MAIIKGTSGNNTLSSTTGKVNDTLYGYAGNDTYKYSLGQGNDTIYESSGSDTLLIADPGQLSPTFNIYRDGNNLVVDFGSYGKVTVASHYTDSAHTLEKLAFSDGWGPFTITKSFTGTASADVLVGTSSAQRLSAGDSDDLIFANGGNDTISGGNGDDEIRGGAGNDLIYGNADDDDLLGGSGSDTMSGGSGWDVVNYYDATTGIVANLSGTSKTLTLDGVSRTLVSGTVYERSAATRDSLVDIEEVEGSKYSDVFYGGRSGNTHFQGNAGNDTFSTGGTGTWTTIGYEDDRSRVIVNLSSAEITVGSKTIAAKTAIDGWGNIDKFYLGTGNVGISGSEFNDYLVGRTGIANWFHGGKGSDTMIGSSGSDYASYSSDDTGVGIIANLSASAITVNSVTVSSNRIRDGFGNTDIVSNIESILGSDYGDTLVGSAASNEFSGNAGNDVLDGGEGEDVLHGNDGNDSLTGGSGRDYLDGGTGSDTFIFKTLADFGSDSNWDEIHDFVSGTDKIDLSAIAPEIGNSSFSFIEGTWTFDGDATNEVWFDTSSGYGIIMISTDADADAECKILLTGTAPVAGDFIL